MVSCYRVKALEFYSQSDMFSTFPDVEVLRLAKRIPQQYTQYLQSMCR